VKMIRHDYVPPNQPLVSASPRFKQDLHHFRAGQQGTPSIHILRNKNNRALIRKRERWQMWQSFTLRVRGSHEADVSRPSGKTQEFRSIAMNRRSPVAFGKRALRSSPLRSWGMP
jgi:hypothetical protein